MITNHQGHSKNHQMIERYKLKQALVPPHTCGLQYLSMLIPFAHVKAISLYSFDSVINIVIVSASPTPLATRSKYSPLCAK